MNTIPYSYNSKLINSERNIRPKLHSYNIKTLIQFNPIEPNRIYSNNSGNIDEHNLINEYSDIAFLETKLNIKMMDFKIKKFKSFLNNYNINNNEQNYITSRNIKKKMQISKKNNDSYSQLRNKLLIKCKDNDEISDIADDIIDAFELDIPDNSEIGESYFENNELVSQDVFDDGKNNENKNRLIKKNCFIKNEKENNNFFKNEVKKWK
jgi:hypothetical protein